MGNQPPRLAASSYSNTAPLIWSFIYGSRRGTTELILDNAPARSAQLLEQGRVDAALVPVIGSQTIEGVSVIGGACVGTKRSVKSVRLVTAGRALADVESVALDVSSRTSAVLTKLIFREFIGSEPEWREAKPDIDKMLAGADAALLIGDPALAVASDPKYLSFDLAELWLDYTGLGFIFAMWMTCGGSAPVDFGAARDEGVSRIPEIAANYAPEIGLSVDQMTEYLAGNITYEPDPSMLKGLDLYLDLAAKHKLIERKRELRLI